MRAATLACFSRCLVSAFSKLDRWLFVQSCFGFEVSPFRCPNRPKGRSMRCSRAEFINHSEVNVIHVHNRTVRRCFLMGDDPMSGRNPKASFKCLLVDASAMSTSRHTIQRRRPANRRFLSRPLPGRLVWLMKHPCWRAASM